MVVVPASRIVLAKSVAMTAVAEAVVVAVLEKHALEMVSAKRQVVPALRIAMARRVVLMAALAVVVPASHPPCAAIRFPVLTPPVFPIAPASHAARMAAAAFAGSAKRVRNAMRAVSVNPIRTILVATLEMGMTLMPEMCHQRPVTRALTAIF